MQAQLEALTVFSYYIGPIWIYAIYKITQMLRLGVESLISTFLLVVIGLFTSLEVSWFVGNIVPYPYGLFTGYWSLPWPIMFWIGLAILCYRRYYSIFRAIMLSFLATISALAVWEIPVHVVTIYLHPTLDHIALTVMLAFPFVIMVIPFRIESRYDIALQKSFPRYWRRYISDVIGRPIIIGLALVALQVLNAKGGLFQADDYPIQFFQMVLRVGFAGIFLEYLWRIPKSRILEIDGPVHSKGTRTKS